MAHLIYDYSANLPAALLDMPGLMHKLHRAAIDSGVFPEAGLRSRALRCEEFLVAAGDPQHGFVNLSMRVGPGRPRDQRLQLGRQLFELMVDHLQPVMAQQGVAISFEMRELEAELRFNGGNLREYLC